MNAAAARDLLDNTYSGVGGLRGVPFMLRAAAKVEMHSRHGWWRARTDRTRTSVLRAADRVRMPATEHDEVFAGHLAGLPLEGLTRAKARLLRSTLRGYPVRFWSVNDDRAGKTDGVVGVFNWIDLEGEWSHSALGAAYDITIDTDWSERDTGPACGGGVSRVLGPASLLRLDVLSPDPWRLCDQCRHWRPAAALVDVDLWLRDDRDFAGSYEPRWCCPENDRGWCS